MGGVPAPRPGFRTQMHRLRLPEPPRSGPQTRRPYTGCHRLYITTRLRRLCTQVIEIGNHERARPPAVDEATAWRQATWQSSYRSLQTSRTWSHQVCSWRNLDLRAACRNLRANAPTPRPAIYGWRYMNKYIYIYIYINIYIYTYILKYIIYCSRSVSRSRLR